MLLFVA